MTALHSLPPDFGSTRDSLHRVAEELLAPARKPDNEIALTPTPGGFGTPWFEFEGERVRVRVEGTDLVREAGDSERRTPLESIGAGGVLLGPALLPGGVPDDARPLAIDPEAAAVLAAYYAFAAEVLWRFRDGLPDGAAPSPAILWPEHLDVALEAGDEAAGRRANYGASPGDEGHPEPYVYVGPWMARPEGELWNASGFPGAELGYAELAAAADPDALALDFLKTRFAALET